MSGGTRLQGVTTYIQSGNVVFRSTESEICKLQTQIEEKIHQDFGFEVKVLLRDKDDLQSVIAENLYTKNVGEDISKLYVTLLSENPKQEYLAKLLSCSFPHDEFELKDKAIFLYCKNGYGNTRLSNDFFEKQLKQKTTTRNWKTMLKMLEMSSTVQ